MSVVTNLILKTPLYDDEEKLVVQKQLNKYFYDSGHCKGIVNCDDDELVPRGWYGGTKMLEAELWLGAFNYLNLEDFVDYLKNEVDWNPDYDDWVQVIVQEQEDEKFRIIEFEVFERKV